MVWPEAQQEPGGAGGEDPGPVVSGRKVSVLKHGLSSHSAAQAPVGHSPRTMAQKLSMADTYSNLTEVSEEVLSKSHRKKKSRLKDKRMP